MIKNEVNVNFSWTTILFFIGLETLTVPLVALSNNIVIHNIIFMAVMGFLVAFICILIILQIVKKIILASSIKVFGFQATKINGVWLIGVLAGILEMIMFIVQDIFFKFGWDDYRVGFISAFCSVGVTLIIYKLGVFFWNLAIKVSDENTTLILDVSVSNIIKLSVLFGFYEFIVCPITGWWIPYQDTQRLMMAIFSGIVGGGIGGLLVVALTRIFENYPVKFILVKVN